jgi:hypothetical protein
MSSLVMRRSCATPKGHAPHIMVSIFAAVKLRKPMSGRVVGARIATPHVWSAAPVTAGVPPACSRR